jgi:hypothetical protein
VTDVGVGSGAWFDVERLAKSSNRTEAVNLSPTLPAIETLLDDRTSLRLPKPTGRLSPK